ncbi:endonuclease/exonuclease/phosphatase family protein [Maribacter sp. ANRC-HE7]|uniref:Endonuclease/exonuclease/phosphatase family protein n=1 Tax=Maribacter aquimaris TaxID=2737171 RepID=A0ABR7V0V8_9FLAO|nr:endonuclease/exonuclease/phosphatase family protein [Maribacter aquimaris]MBD0778470.1 endonuclease/exonuclease/phosphatase family protein [Maribacter aquimaris]
MFRKLFLWVFLFLSLGVFSQNREIQLVSWNIQDFGKTKNAAELEQMAEMVRDADILIIQEVVSGYGGAQAVARLNDVLNRKGSKWDYVISNPTNSPKYVTERYAYIWKTKHIKIKNRGYLINALDTLIDREPFLLDVFVDGKKLTLVNFHSRPYNKNPEGEINALTGYVMANITSPMVLAGDFNMEESQSLFDGFKAQGFKAAITNQKTTLKKVCDGTNYLNHAIDNIFYSKEIRKTKSGVIDFVRFCDGLEAARKLSDHLPVYIRFGF